MKQCGYSIKAILKHKVSIIVFCMLLLINFFTMVNMIKVDLENTAEKQIQEYQLHIYSYQTIKDNQYAIDMGGYYNNTELSYLENYFNSMQWSIDSSKEELAMLEKGEDISQSILIHGLIENMIDMDFVMDIEHGNDYFENVFNEEIERYSDKLNLSELPFNSKDLHLHPYRDGYLLKDQRDVFYHNEEFKAKYAFYLLDHDLSDLELTTPSPWSFLMKQLGKDSLLPFILFPLAILFSTVYLYDVRQKQSLKLLMTQGTNRRQVIFAYGFSLLVAFILLSVISLLIPMILLGFKSGWTGFNLPVLIDVDGLQSFTLFEHLDTLHTFKLSTYPSALYIDTIVRDDFIPLTMDFMQLWQVLLITSVLAIFKYACAIVIGMLCLLCPKKNWQSYTLLGCCLMLYLGSQSSTAGYLSAVNVFDLRSCLLILEGCTHITTLHAFCISIATLILISGITIKLFHDIDYQE